jgi:hypothetical protein
MVDVLPNDAWPRAQTNLAPQTCRGPVSSYTVFGRDKAPTAVRKWAEVREKKMHEAPGLVRPLQDGVLVRDPDKALVKVDRAGKRTMLAPGACGGMLLHTDAQGNRLLVVCGSTGSRTGGLTVFEGGRSFDLGPVPVPGADAWLEARNGVVDWDGTYVDVQQHKKAPRRPLLPNDVQLVDNGTHGQATIFAIRGDGAKLQAVAPVKRERDIPMARCAG